MRRWPILALVAACAPGAGEPAASSGALVGPAAATAEIVLEPIRSAPAGGDGPTIHRLVRVSADGSRSELSASVVAAVPVPGGVLAVDADRTLLRFDDRAPGAPERIGQDVVGTPAADGSRVAWASGGPTVDLHVRGTGAPPIDHTGLGTAGALRFSPDGRWLVFVGAAPGGVAGVMSVELRGGALRCLTGCQLRAGRPWGDAFVPPPRSAAAMRFDGDVMRWRVDGREHAVALAGGGGR